MTRLVVVSHRLISYGEAIAAAVRHCRPGVGVCLLAPLGLVEAIAHLRPSLVISDALPLPDDQGHPSWIALYPDGANRADYRIDGRQETVPDVTIHGLLTLIDRGLAASKGDAVAR